MEDGGGRGRTHQIQQRPVLGSKLKGLGELVGTAGFVDCLQDRRNSLDKRQRHMRLAMCVQVL